VRAEIETMPVVQLGNDGVMIRVRNENGTNVGKFWFGQANIKWARGNVSKHNAKVIPVQDLVAWLDAH
jgi:hypothetical protein